MSTTKSTASLELLWSESLSFNTIEAISNFCKRCEVQLPSPFLFKTSFQRSFYPSLISYLNKRPLDMHRHLETLNDLLKLSISLFQHKKFKYEKSLIDLIDSAWGLISYLISNPVPVPEEAFDFISTLLIFTKSMTTLSCFHQKHEEKIEKVFHQICENIKTSENYQKIHAKLIETQNFSEFLTCILSIFLGIIQKSKKDVNEANIFSSLSELMTSVERDRSQVQNKSNQNFLINDRFLLILEIVVKLSEKQKNFGSKMISACGEKLKVLIVEFIQNTETHEIKVSSFKADPNQLASLFSLTFKFFKSISKSNEKDPTAWNIPLIIFQMVLSLVFFIQAKNKDEEVLILYILEFIYDFYASIPVIRVSVSDFSIGTLLFHEKIFCSSSEKVRETWKMIWNELFDFEYKSKNMFESILSNLRENRSEKYLKVFTQWVEELIKNANPDKCLEYLMKFQIVDGIFNILQDKADKNYKVFLVSLVELLTTQKKVEVLNSLNSFFVLITKVVNLQPDFAENYEKIIINYLKMNKVEIFMFWIKTMREVKNESVATVLVRSFFTYIQRNDGNFFYLKSLDREIFKFLSSFSEEIIEINFWKFLVLSQVKIVSHLSFEYLESDFYSFLPLMNQLRQSVDISEIADDLKEPIKEALFNEESKTIRFPQLIPLYGEVLFSSKEPEFQESEIKRLKTSEINLDLLAKHGLFSILMKNLKSLEMWKKCESLCLQIISSHFSTSDLNIWVKTFKSCKDPALKASLLETLKSGVNKLTTSEKMLKYVYFNNDCKVFLDFTNENFHLPKDFCIVFWVFSDFIEKSSVFSFKHSGETTEILVFASTVSVKISNQEEIFEGLSYNSWNLVCINFSVKLQVLINGNFSESKEKKNWRPVKPGKLEKCCVGNNCAFSAKNCFLMGKLASLVILKKTLDFGSVQEFLNQFRRGSQVLLIQEAVEKEFKDLILLDLLDEKVLKKDSGQGAYLLQKTPAYKCFKIYGLRRFMLEVHSSIKDSEALQEFFKLMKVLVFINDIDSEYFTQHSINFLAYLMSKAEYSEEMSEIFISILDLCTENQLQIIQNLIKNERKFLNFLKNSPKFLRFFIQKFVSINPITRENLLALIETLEQVETELFSEYLSFYLNSQPKDLLEEAIPPVVAYLEIHQAYETLFKVLVSVKIVELKLSKPILGVLLPLFDKRYPLNLQILLLDLIFLGGKVSSKLFQYIDDHLPNEISPEFLQYLLTNSFDANCRSSNSGWFLRIIINRLRFFDQPDYKKAITTSFNENKDIVFEYALKLETFPGFLLDVHCNSENASESSKYVQVLLEIAAEKLAAVQIKTFLNTTKDLQLFKHLLQKFADTESVSSVLESFEVLQDELTSKPEVISEISTMLETSFVLNLAKNALEKFKVSSLQVKNEDSKDFLTNFLNFLVFGLSVFRGSGLRFEFFRGFLESQEIQFFTRSDQNSQLKTSEIFYSVYVLIELLKKYLQGCEGLKEDLVFFIYEANLQEKLGTFCEKHTTVIKNSLRDVICSESVLEINRENVESKVENKLNLFIHHQQRLKALIDCYDLENSEIFTDTQVLNEIIQVFEHLFTKFVIKVPESPKKTEPAKPSKVLNHEKLLRWSKDFKELSWASDFKEQAIRKSRKLIQDCKFFSKSVKNLKKILNFPNSPPCKVRQIYDKAFRWSTFKPCCLQSSERKSSAKKLSDPPVIYLDLKESTQSTDGNSDSANVSDNCSQPSRANTCVYKTSNTFKPVPRSFWVERIKIQGSVLGKLFLSSEYFDLNFEGLVKSPEMQGALAFTRLPEQKRRIWHVDEFLEVLPKRFLHKHTALEFVLKNGKSYYLNFFTASQREDALKVLKGWKAEVLNSTWASKLLDSYKNDWKRGGISNFDYLMLLNRLSSRSLNDLSQYPIFPWILSNYYSDLLDFNDKSMFRDLRLPVGAQKPEYQIMLQEKIESWKDDFFEPYHHGSHYSNGGIVLHYLIRVEPFSTQAKHLQGGNFDIADRLFYSMARAWESCIENIGTDNKELVPELFYSSLILDNPQGQYLGTNSSGLDVSRVQPPDWAISNWDFIVKHRNLLESENISKDLHNWIDLIFGFKQGGKNALASFNVFNSVTYEGLFEDFVERHENLEMASMVEQVYHFGQTPQVLFEGKAHPAREEGWKSLNLYNYFYFNTGKDLAYKAVEKGYIVNGNLVFFHLATDFLLFIKEVGGLCFLCRFLVKNTLEIVSVLPEVQLNGYFPAFSHSIQYTSLDFSYRSFDFSSFNYSFSLVLDKFLVVGLDRSFELKVFDLKGKLLQSLPFHSQLVLAVSSSSEQVFSGSSDCSIKCWNLDKDSFSRSLTFFGHSAPVVLIKVIQSYQVLVSTSAEGLVLIHDTKSAECLNSLNFPATLIDAHDYGLILLATRFKVLIIGVNCETVSEFEVESQLQSVQISPCGNFCIEGHEHEVVLRDVFSLNTERCEKMECLKYMQVLIHRSELGMMYWAQSGREGVVGALRYFSMKKLESKNEIILDLI